VEVDLISVAEKRGFAMHQAVRGLPISDVGK